MKKVLIAITAVVLVGIIVLVLVLTLSLDSLVKKGVETVGPQITKTEMKLDGATISIFSGSGSLKGFFLGNPEGYKSPSAVKVGQVSLGVEPRSVLSDKVHVTRVLVNAPEITFEGTLGTQNNLNKILENVQAATGGKETTPSKTEPGGKGASRKLQVDDFLISGAKVNVTLTTLGSKSLTVPLPEIHLTNLGTGPEGITAAELTQKVLSQVNAATLQAVEKAVANVSKAATDALNDVSKGATQSLDKATKKVGDLFQKK